MAFTPDVTFIVLPQRVHCQLYVTVGSSFYFSELCTNRVLNYSRIRNPSSYIAIFFSLPGTPLKGTLEIKTKCYKISLRLNHYSVRTVKAIDFLFSTLHTIPFLYGKILLGVLHMLHTSIATFDTPPGPNPP